MTTQQFETEEMQTQLAVMEDRRAALVEEKDRAETELTDARALLREGADDALNMATLAQARFTALNETLSELDAETEMLRADLEAARAVQRRAEIVRQLVELANSGCKNWQVYERAMEQANEALGAHVEHLLKAMNDLGNDRRRFVALSKELAPGITELTRMRSYDGDEQRQADLDALIAELEAAGADLSAVSVEWTTHFRTAIDRNVPAPSAEPYGPAIQGACQIARRLNN